MSSWDDLEAVAPQISNEDAERLISGTSSIDEAHDLADLDKVFRVLRGPAESAELTGLQSALSAFGAGVVTTQSDPSTARTRPMIKKLLTGKAIATIAAVTLASAGAAAAAGVVPGPFSAPRPIVSTSTDVDDDSTEQTVTTDAPATTLVATLAGHETTAADPTDADAAAQSPDVGGDTADSQGPDVNGPAKFGLCTAFEARTKHDDTTNTEGAATPAAEPVAEDSDSVQPVPFQALQDTADAAGQTVADFCADAVPGGAIDKPGKSGDNPSVTAPGKSDDNPSATAPRKSDDNPSTTAPRKSNDNPSATAPGGPPKSPSAGHGQPSPTHP